MQKKGGQREEPSTRLKWAFEKMRKTRKGGDTRGGGEKRKACQAVGHRRKQHVEGDL